MPQFRTGIEKVSDLKTGMQLEGVVSNVTNFGAFVDVGVHQDGLVHISQLADRYVSGAICGSRTKTHRIDDADRKYT